MQRKITLPCILGILVLLALGAQNVSGAPGDMIQITNVSAPPTVGAGQSLTVMATVSYSLQLGENLALGIVVHGNSGVTSSYPLTSMSSNCIVGMLGQVCVAQTSVTEGVFTATLTLNAPNTLGAWQPSVVAFIARGTNPVVLTVVQSASSVLTITVTPP